MVDFLPRNRRRLFRNGVLSRRWDRHPIPGADPVPNYIIKYLLDGSDSTLTRVGLDDFRLAPACNEAVGSWFDGISQYYNASQDSAKVAVGTGAFSISCWLNTISTDTGCIISNGRGSTLGDFVLRARTDGLFSIRIDEQAKNTNAEVNDGKWHHCVVTCEGSGSGVTFYIDGVFDKISSSLDYNLTDQGILGVGIRDLDDNFFNGGLDDIRFYNRELTQTEVTSIYEYRCSLSPSNTQTDAWYDASDVSSTNIIQSSGLVSQWSDKSGNVNDVTQVAGASQPISLSSDINGLNSLLFDGVDDFLEVAKGFANPSVLMVVNDEADGTQHSNALGIDSQDTSEAYRYYSTSRIANVVEYFADYTTSGVFLQTPVPVNASIYEFIEGSSTDLYIDGVLRDSGTPVGGPKYALAQLTYVGTGIFNHLGSAFLVGKMGEMIIIDGPVTEELRQKLEGYLAWKWFPTTDRSIGNPVLDVSHPYKIEPPKEL